MTRADMTAYMVGRPASTFVVFAHQGGGPWSVDLQMRKSLGLVYRTPPDTQFSMCGVCWFNGKYVVLSHRDGLCYRRHKFVWYGPSHFFELPQPASKYARGLVEWFYENHCFTDPGYIANRIWKCYKLLIGDAIHIAEVQAEPLAEALAMYTIPDRPYVNDFKDFDPFKIYRLLKNSGIRHFQVEGL